MKILNRLLLPSVLCATLSACALPSYKPTSNKLILLKVSNPESQGFLMVRKLDENCGLQASFPNVVGKNPKQLHVDPGEDFSFQLIYVTPYLIGCEVKGTIPSLSDNANYHIIFTAPQVGDAKDKKCSVKLEVINPPPFEWKPAEFSGRCSKNERF